MEKNKTFFLLLIFCGFVSFAKLPFNVIYIFVFSLFFIHFYYALKSGFFSKFYISSLLFSVFLFISQFIGIYTSSQYFGTEANYLSFVLFCVCIMLGGVTYDVCYSNEITKESINKIHLFVLFFLSLDLFVRFFIPFPGVDGLYKYKSSYFYTDSNFSGLVLVSFFSLYIYSKSKSKLSPYMDISFYIYSLLIMLSYSRAAMFTYLFMLLILGNIKTVKFKILPSLILCFTIFLYFTGLYFNDRSALLEIDGSLNSKFYIAELIIDEYNKLPLLSKVFGIGLGNSKNIIGIFAHNIILTFFFELGAIGSLLFIIFIVKSLSLSKFESIYIWLPTLILGMSLFSSYSPFLFIINALLVFYSRKVNDEK